MFTNEKQVEEAFEWIHDQILRVFKIECNARGRRVDWNDLQFECVDDSGNMILVETDQDRDRYWYEVPIRWVFMPQVAIEAEIQETLQAERQEEAEKKKTQEEKADAEEKALYLKLKSKYGSVA